MRTLRTASFLLLLTLPSGAQDYVGEHLPGRAKPPLPGQLPNGLAPYAARVGGRADPVFDRLVDQALPTLLAFDPVRATELGFHQYDAMLPDADSMAVRAEIDTLRSYDIRFRAVGEAGLDEVRRADHARMLRAIAAARPHERDPVHFVDVASRGIKSLLVPFAPLEERAWNVVARVNAIGPFLRSGRANLEHVGIARADALEAITRSRELVAFLSNELPVAMKDVKDPVLREELDHHLAQAAGAAADYHDWLVSEALPRAAGAPAPFRQEDSLAELVGR